MPKGNRSHAKNKRPAFLEALATGATIADAAKIAGIGRRTAYQWREHDEDFAAVWDEAYREGADALADEAKRRAVEGVRSYLYHQGEPIMVENPETGIPEHAYELKYSDVLLMMLMKARDPERYCDRVRLARIMRRWAEEDGKAGTNAAVPADAVLQLLSALAAKKAAEPEPEPPAKAA